MTDYFFIATVYFIVSFKHLVTEKQMVAQMVEKVT